MDDIYILQQEVGRGSYGVVFKGRVTETGWWGEKGDTVAIKRLPCCSPESIEVCLQELCTMRITAQNHPNVISLYNCLLQTGPRTLQPLKSGKLPLDLVESALKGRVVDKDSKTQLRNSSRSKRRLMSTEEVPRRCFALWLVMEYCEGGDLSQYILSRLPDAECNCAVVQQLGSAIAFLHRNGIVHRDIKPDNILVCLTKTGPVMKVQKECNLNIYFYIKLLFYCNVTSMYIKETILLVKMLIAYGVKLSAIVMGPICIWTSFHVAFERVCTAIRATLSFFYPFLIFVYLEAWKVFHL